jgi:enoyl-CoA hydratase/carnithine racemase
MPAVHLEIDAGVAVLTLDDPERHNAWSSELEAMFYERLDAVDTDPAVRVVVMTGSGRMFCPGASSDRLAHIAEVGLGYSDRIPFTKTLMFRKPLIAAINGGCAGIGFIQAMSATSGSCPRRQRSRRHSHVAACRRSMRSPGGYRG